MITVYHYPCLALPLQSKFIVNAGVGDKVGINDWAIDGVIVGVGVGVKQISAYSKYIMAGCKLLLA